MIIHKVTYGTVVQVFDTETRKFVSQSFVAEPEIDPEWEIPNAGPIHSYFNLNDANELIYGKGGVDEPSFPFNMKQP